MSDNPLVSRPLTDTGTAECLVALYGDTFRFCSTLKRSENAWLVWDGSRWQLDDSGAVTRAIIDLARKRYDAFKELPVPSDDKDAQTFKEKGMLYARQSENFARMVCCAKIASELHPFTSRLEDFDANPMLAGLPNGLTLDLDTCEARPARQSDNLTLQLGTRYDKDAKCPRWRKFMNEIAGGDVQLRLFLQRCVGYTLLGDNREQALFLCHGSGANGKSTFLNILSRLFGDYAASTPFATFDAATRTEQTEDLARLRGKRLVTVIEADEDKRLAEARVKAITGDDPITCAFKYGHHFEYVPAFAPWVAVNHRPIIRDTTDSIWRRIKSIHFKQSFTGATADKNLKAALLDELPGILNWALDGLRVWHQEGLNVPPSVLEDLADYRQENDQIEKWLSECCSVDAGVGGRSDETPANEAYKAYQQWVEERGERPFSQTKFGRQLADKGFPSNRLRRGEGNRTVTIYSGFTLLKV